VAENQPFKNRVNTTSSFAEFGAQLRGLLHADFERQALELFRLQFEANGAYRLICESRGVTPEKVSHWSEIPAVPTAAFKEFELSCLASEQRTRVFHSSGTTGQKPSRHYHGAESLMLYEEALMAAFRENVVKKGPIPIVALTPTGTEAPHSSLVHMFETVRRQLGTEESVFAGRVTRAGEWTVDFGVAETALSRACESNRPVCVLGTAFSFVHMLDYLREHSRQFKLPPGSVVMETGGYKGRSRAIPRAELHELMCRYLGTSQIVCEYGMSELSSQAYGRVTGDAWRVTGGDRKAYAKNSKFHPPSSKALWRTRTPNSIPQGGTNSKLQTDNSELENPPLLRGYGEASGGPVFYFPKWVRCQIISPETGREVKEDEMGLIRVFDLANVYSVMAIQTEDLGIKRGNGFELVGRASLAEPRGCSLMASE
jgi:Acyl-protein synthetase, LuxE